MVNYSLDALKKSSKRKEVRIKKKKVEVLQQTICIVERRKKSKKKIGIMNFLAYVDIKVI